MEKQQQPMGQPPAYDSPEVQQNTYQQGGVPVAGYSQQPPTMGPAHVQQHTVYVTGLPTVVTTTPATVIAVGSCPACRSGVLVDNFTCLGIFLGILFFPIGIICCMLMTEKRCTNCHATFG